MSTCDANTEDRFTPALDVALDRLLGLKEGCKSAQAYSPTYLPEDQAKDSIILELDDKPGEVRPITDKNIIQTTFSESGERLTETQEGCTFPAELTFKCVNNYVHDHDVQFEDLQNLCLGMANEIEKLNKKLNQEKQ